MYGTDHKKGQSQQFCKILILNDPKKEQILPAEINNKVHPETHFSLTASSFSKNTVLQTKLQEYLQQYLIAFQFKKAYVIFP